MHREYPRWTVAMFPTLRTATLPPGGSVSGDLAKVLATLLGLQKKAQKEA